MSSAYPSLGPALRFLRTRRHLKQTEVSAKSGMTKAMLSAYETSKNTPSFPSLIAYLRAVAADFVDLQNALEAVGGDVLLPRSSRGSATEPSWKELREVLGDLAVPLSRLAAAIEKTSTPEGTGES